MRKLLIIIILIAVFLRLWMITLVPPGIHSDEADMGYAAYSVLKTGQTQYATFNSLAFGEFNGGTFPPFVSYAMMPFIYLFGLNIVTERLPSILFGIGTIPVMFFLVKKLFQSDAAALVASFLIAINPWSIFVSRQGLLETPAVFFGNGRSYIISLCK